MIQKIYGAYIGTCDVCQEKSKEYDTYQDCVDGMRKEGFAIFRMEGEWAHVCEGCGGCEE